MSGRNAEGGGPCPQRRSRLGMLRGKWVGAGRAAVVSVTTAAVTVGEADAPGVGVAPSAAARQR